MTNLLISLSEFQLPEWLTLGNAVSALTSLITLIAALIKLSNNKKSSDSTFAKMGKLLENNINILSNLASTVESVNTLCTNISDMLDKAITALSEQNKASNNVAAFIFECFNLSNLSDENKLKLKVLYDQLFYKTDAAIIDDLKAAKTDADKMLVEKTEYIKRLENDLKDAQAKLNSVQSTIRKTRRVSN